ncbi:unnamed protein product [Pleuronectes platessa]|uniref:Uncharacterized protein n=1 Tax=Pleuronectes platessa TaxID=8262 RepID=A0A9N7V2Q6_PLEPL|nr:unnamed protein product [Pleuronectes platessa]
MLGGCGTRVGSFSATCDGVINPGSQPQTPITSPRLLSPPSSSSSSSGRRFHGRLTLSMYSAFSISESLMLFPMILTVVKVSWGLTTEYISSLSKCHVKACA